MRIAMPFVLSTVIFFMGCGEGDESPAEYYDDTDTDTDTGELLGEGEDCSGGGQCAEGLVCSGVDGTCQQEGAPGTTPEEGDCLSSWECQYGLVCAANGTCQSPGEPGTGSAGDDCQDDGDCMFFLECLDGECQGFQPPYWAGATCDEPDDESVPLRLIFDAHPVGTDFYQLPFPNDARLSGGHIDLSGHPDPGELVPAIGDPARLVMDMVENDIGGFGTQSYAFFRFNRWPDPGSLVLGTTVYIVDIDPASDHYGETQATAWRAASKRGLYICPNWIAVGPTLGRPLRGGRTYAAILTTGITDKEGVPVERDEDFVAVMSASQPSDSALLGVWQAYQPLRDYLADQGIDSATIASAAVFTTQRPEDHLAKIREAVRSEPQPTTSGITVDMDDPDFDLYTGQVTVPFYQAGTRPFKDPADGGAIAWNSSGLPIRVEDESVNFALAVPKGTAPAGGWPVVVYAHGTGGSHMSFVEEEVAAELAAVGVAVIGVEQVMHGDRRGLPVSEADLEANSPERLVYNLLNPRAARDNVLQTAADHFQVVRLLEGFAAITGEPVVFDLDNVFFFGHSQGSQGGALFAAHEPLVKLVVLSGAGSYLTEGLLGKTKPVNVAAALQIAFTDLNVDRFHPLLNLLQAAFESVDPGNYARSMFFEALVDEGHPRRSVFMSYGIGDTYTPENSMNALARSLLVQQWPIAGHEIEGVTSIESLPHTTTYNWGATGAVTAVVVQYEPDGYDGHFVIFENPDAETQYTEFVRTMVENGIPTLVAVD